jgi:nucleoside-diphosphate-sugar epimerase
MNILLTGHTGFIGSHTLNRLREHHNVTAIDVRVPVKPAVTAPKALRPFCSIQGDLSEDSAYQQLAKQSFDTIIHLAALNESALLSTMPSELFRANVASTQKLLRFAIDHEINHFIFASSTPIENQSAYTKTGAEMLAKVYHSQYDLGVTTLRFPMVYGPGQNEDAPLSRLAKALVENRSYPEDDISGQQLYIADAVNAIEQTTQNCATSHRLIDLSNQYELTVAEIIQQMKSALGIEPTSNRSYQKCRHQQWDDISINQQLIDFKAMTTPATGIGKFCKWFLSQDSSERSSLHTVTIPYQ